MIRLLVGVSGVEEEKEVTFNQNIVKAGRLKDNDLMLPGGNISRLHFTITFEETEYYLTDCSANGTLLNGERLVRDQRRPLRDQDLIQAGDFLIHFSIVSETGQYEKTTDYLQAKFAQFMAGPAEEKAGPYLLIVGGPTGGTKVELHQEMMEILLGRTPDCPLQIPSPTVSKQHARIIRRGDILELEDLGSVNGTMINGRLIQGITRLHDRDEIVPGQKATSNPIRIVLSIPVPPSAAPAAGPPLPAEAAAAVPPPAVPPPAAPPAVPSLPAAEPAIPEPVFSPSPPPSAGPAKSAAPAEAPPPPAPPSPAPPVKPPPATKPVLLNEPPAVIPPGPETSPPPPADLKAGLGLLEYIIIGAAVLGLLVVVVILILVLGPS